MTITRHAQFVGPADVFDALCVARVSRIRSWDNRAFATTTGRAILGAARTTGVTLESVFDAAHGARYLCFAYRNADERAACWRFLVGE